MSLAISLLVLLLRIWDTIFCSCSVSLVKGEICSFVLSFFDFRIKKILNPIEITSKNGNTHCHSLAEGSLRSAICWSIAISLLYNVVRLISGYLERKRLPRDV